MPKFQIKLADKIIEIVSQYKEVFKLCADYLCEEGKPDMRIVSTREAIAYEKHRDSESMHASKAYLETLAIYRAIAERMLEHSTFLMHGSVVAVGKEAFMFTAASGVGKTTRTNMWLEQIEGSYVVNGDKPLLKVCESGTLACGTPWSGKEQLHSNVMVPLRAIVFLERSERTDLKKISFSEAFVQLLQQTYRPQDPKLMAKTLGLLKKMGTGIEFYWYYMNLDDMDMRWLYEKIRTGADCTAK